MTSILMSRTLDKDGRLRLLRAKFFVGAEGKAGFTRKYYSNKKALLWRIIDKLVSFMNITSWIKINCAKF